MASYAGTLDERVLREVNNIIRQTLRSPPPAIPIARTLSSTFKHCRSCTCTPPTTRNVPMAVVRPYRPDPPRVVENGSSPDVGGQEYEEEIIVLDDEEERSPSPTPSDRSWTPGRSSSSPTHSTSHSSSSGDTRTHGRRTSKRLRNRIYGYADDYMSSEEEYMPSGTTYRRVDIASDDPMPGPSTSVASRVPCYRPPTTLSSTDDESTLEYEPR